MGVAMFRELRELLARMDESPNLRVVVFESANPEFYLAHFDLTDIAGSLGLMQSASPSGPTGLMATFVRLPRSPAVGVARFGGRPGGAAGECVLAGYGRCADRR